MIRPPISQVGWASASPTPTPERSLRPRNGPPDAVSTSRWTVPGRSAPISWKSAECSESTGSRRAPVASARAMVSSPPTTRLSLLARATSIPSVRATTVGPRPAAPTIPLRTRSAPDSATSSRTPSSPSSTRPSQAERARSAASGSARATRGTPCRPAASRAASQPERAASPTTWSSSEEATISQGLGADRAGAAQDDDLLHGLREYGGPSETREAAFVHHMDVRTHLRPWPPPQ